MSVKMVFACSIQDPWKRRGRQIDFDWISVLTPWANVVVIHRNNAHEGVWTSILLLKENLTLTHGKKMKPPLFWALSSLREKFENCFPPKTLFQRSAFPPSHIVVTIYRSSLLSNFLLLLLMSLTLSAVGATAVVCPSPTSHDYEIPPPSAHPPLPPYANIEQNAVGLLDCDCPFLSYLKTWRSYFWYWS